MGCECSTIAWNTCYRKQLKSRILLSVVYVCITSSRPTSRDAWTCFLSWSTEDEVERSMRHVTGCLAQRSVCARVSYVIDGFQTLQRCMNVLVASYVSKPFTKIIPWQMSLLYLNIFQCVC